MKQAKKTLGDKYTGPDPEAGVEIPEGGEFVWNEFWKLRRSEPLSYAEIESYCRLSRTRFRAWELEALREMDAEVTKWRDNAGRSKAGDTG